MKLNRAQIKHACSAVHQLVTVVVILVIARTVYLEKVGRPGEVEMLVIALAIYVFAQFGIHKALGQLPDSDEFQGAKEHTDAVV